MLQFYQHLPNQDINEHYLWQQRLEPSLQYLSEQHREKVREALSLAYDAHTTQKRKSGEPYITHPVEVTRILAELKMDHESLIAGQNMPADICHNSACLFFVLHACVYTSRSSTTC